MSYALSSNYDGIRSLLTTPGIDPQHVFAAIHEKDHLFPLFLKALGDREMMSLHSDFSRKVITQLPASAKDSPEFAIFMRTLVGTQQLGASELAFAFKEACIQQNDELAFEVLGKIDLSQSASVNFIHIACHSDNPQVLQVVLEKLGSLKSASWVQERNVDGRSPLEVVCLKGNALQVRLLLEAGAEVRSKDPLGWTALHTVAHQGNVEIARMLLDKGADSNATNLRGETPLHQLVFNENVEVATLLLDRGAHLDIANEEGLTPFHLAIAQEKLIIAPYFLQRGASVNVQDKEGSTPLHTAALNNSVEALELICPLVSDLNVKDNQGFSPLDKAQLEEQWGAEAFLIRQGAENRDIFQKLTSYSTRISTSPPLPEEGINDPHSEAHRAKFTSFVNLHDSSLQPAIHAMVQSIDYVSFSAFSAQFDACVQSLNASIAPGEKYLVVVEPQKSNKWLAEMAFPKLKQLPANIVTLNQIKEALQRDPSIKTIVFFDDASYSGEQLCRFIRKKAIKGLTENHRDQFKIHVAVPYMTETAESKLRAILHDQAVRQHEGQILLTPHQRMRSASAQVDAVHHSVLMKTYFPYAGGKDLLFLTQGTTNQSDDSVFFNDDILTALESLSPEFEIDKILELKDLIPAILGQVSNSESLTNEQLHTILIEDPRILSLARDIKLEIEAFQRDHWDDLQNRKLDATNESELRVLDELENALKDAESIKKELEFEVGLRRTFTVFDHKIADHLSTCPGFERGEIFYRGSPVLNTDQSATLSVDDLFLGKPPYKMDYT